MPAKPIHTCARYNAPSDATLKVLLESLENVLVLESRLRETGNTVHKEDGLYEVEVLPNFPLWKLLYDEHAGVERDKRLLLQLAIDQSVPTTLGSFEEQGGVAELGPWGRGQVRSIDEFGDWIALLRDQLKAWRGRPDIFYAESCLAFPNFVFSNRFPDCLETFKGNFEDFISEIVSALIFLADDMPTCMAQPTTRECMKAFSAISGYETSMEGNAKRKSALTFEFKNEDRTLKILCEPHIKLHRSAQPGDTEYYSHRIYFSSTEHAEFPTKFLIGHIGEHL